MTNLADPARQTLTNLPVTLDANSNRVITHPGINSAPTFYRLSVQLAP
jgi:hypothetical protein